MPTSPCQTVYISTPMWPVCIPVQHSTDTGPLLFPSAESPTSSDSGDGSTVVSSDDPPTEHTFPSLLDYSPPQSKRSSYSQSPLVSPVIPHSSSTFPSPVYRYDVSESPHGSLSQKVRNYKSTFPDDFDLQEVDKSVSQTLQILQTRFGSPLSARRSVYLVSSFCFLQKSS